MLINTNTSNTSVTGWFCITVTCREGVDKWREKYLLVLILELVGMDKVGENKKINLYTPKFPPKLLELLLCFFYD